MRPIGWVLAGVVAVIAAALALVWLRGDRDGPVHHGASTALDEPVALQGVLPSPSGARDTIAEATAIAPNGTVDEPSASAPDVAAPTVQGRVLDVEGRAVPDVVLAFGRDEVEVVADARGEFTVDAALVDAWPIAVRSSDHVLVGSGRRSELAGRPLVVVVARATRLTGDVVHEDGTPAPQIGVRFSTSLAALGSFPVVLEQPTWWESVWTTSASDGRFEFERVPRAFGSLEAGGHDAAQATKHLVPSDEPVTLVLRSTRQDALVVSGIVVDAAGARVTGASVHMGSAETETAADGSFELELAHMGIRPGAPIPAHVAGYTLAAIREGSGPAAIPGFGARLADPAARRDVVLRLGERALVIEGRVVHADGAPAAGWIVVLVDATPLGNTSETVETLAQLEYRLRSDADGRFRIPGLLDREYLVCAIDEATALAIEGRVAAGTDDLVLRVPAAPWRAVAGVVRSRTGQPVGGADVASYRLVSESSVMMDNVVSPPVRTDAEGRFALARVPRRGASLAVSGSGVQGWPIEELDDGERDAEVELVVPLALRFRLELAAGAAEELAVVDAEGTELSLCVLLPDSRSFFRRYKVRESLGTRVFEVEDTATEIVLFRDGAEVRRIPLDLVPGEVTLVRG